MGPSTDNFKIKHLYSGFPRALEMMENLENHKKRYMHERIMDFEKKE